ncbi:MAG: vWA domain-containing protein [Pseudomonadota bacterium]
MKDKKTLYQRVLTRPGAVVTRCDATRTCLVKDKQEVPPFTIFYVYKREKNGKVQLLVGPNARGTLSGFVNAAHTIEWQHGLVLSFEKRAGRERVLFFDKRDPMLTFLADGQMTDRLKKTYAAVDKGEPSPFPEVIAVEPNEYVDIRKQFYLLPVLKADGETIRVAGKRKRTNVVEVASVTRTLTPKAPQTSTRSNNLLKDYRSAIVFVIDASGSMQREIDSTRQALLDIYQRVETEKLQDKVRFGLIGYRDDPKEVQGIEYLSKVFVDPAGVDSSKEFLEAAKGLAASQVSTRSWAEDGFAGLKQAVDSVKWSEFGGRYIVFMTDASSRGATESPDKETPASSTQLSAQGMNELALEKEVAIYAFHILTPEAERRGDVEIATEQYNILSRYPGTGALYYKVTSARQDEAAYRKAVSQLTDALISQVHQTSAGQLTEEPESKQLSQEDQVKAVGRAMQLAYLGRRTKAEAPPMVRAWAIDTSPGKNTLAMKVRLLLTKDRLSDLRNTLRQVRQAAIESEFSPQEFLPKLTALSLRMGRDPELGTGGYAQTFADTHLLEYLEGLPYQTTAMNLNAKMWATMSAAEQFDFIDDLQSKISQYESIHDDSANWTPLHSSDEPGDAVYAMPLDLLP